MRITATRRVQFAVGHRVHRHESKCRHLHGHNYVFFLTAESIEDQGPEGLDDRGRVVDFGVLKAKLGTWIEEHWDHGFLVWEGDVEARRALGMIPGQKGFLLPYNPTAENMARYLLDVCGPNELEDTGVRLCKVVIYETENCIAEVTREFTDS